MVISKKTIAVTAMVLMCAPVMAQEEAELEEQMRQAEARLVDQAAAEADHAGAGARRRSHPALGQDDVAGSKENAARRGATIVFVDESGFSERPAVRRTWAPRGQTPVLTHRFRSWNNLSVIGALAYRARSPQHARVFLMTHPGAVRSPQVVRFLRHLRRHVCRPGWRGRAHSAPRSTAGPAPG